MYAQFFGNFLLSRNIVTCDQLIQAMKKKSTEHMKLGTLAIHASYMTAKEVDEIYIEQTHQDKRFGELAIKDGYLTKAQVTELLKDQGPDYLLLGQVLVEEGIIDNEQLQSLIIEYQSANELDDFVDYSEETQESIQHLVENFFVATERPLSPFEVSFLQLLFNNLIRFIGDDFTPVYPYPCTEYPTNYCVSQQILGEFSIKIFIDMTKSTAIEFASRYVGDTFDEFDEYVQSSIEDFLNLHNGLFNVNISNEHSVELNLTPPEREMTELLSFNNEGYLLPIVFPFGTIHFILVVTKSR